MTLLDSIRDAAQRMIAQRELDALMRTCRHLLSAQGEANSAGLASKAIEHYGRLPEAVQGPSTAPCTSMPAAKSRRSAAARRLRIGRSAASTGTP